MQRSSGKAPTRGWMVSDPGSEHIVPGNASAREIEEYRQANKNPTPVKRYIGGWADEGKTYLDQSRNVRSSKKAQQLGREGAQRAVYNVHRDKVTRVHHGGRIDVRDTLFEGHPEAAKGLRLGNSDAVRQRTENQLHRSSAVPDLRPPPRNSDQFKQSTLF